MNNLPTLAELHYDAPTAFKNDELNLLLYQPPHQSWLKKFPAEMGITGSYLPIDKVEYMLTRIFQEWHVEILREGTAFQSCFVVVRLHMRNPLNGQWFFQDGIGAAPVQTDKGSSAADLGAIKTRAVQIAFPIAKSTALKDAAEHLGTLFGKDLNRKDTVQFAGAYLPLRPVQQETPVAPTSTFNTAAL
jgi:hypothetical protein